MIYSFKVSHWMYVFAMITSVTLVTSCHKNDFRGKELQQPATAVRLNAGAVFVSPANIGSFQVITVPASFVSTSIARFNGPSDMVLGPSGALYIADYYNNRIRKIQ